MGYLSFALIFEVKLTILGEILKTSDLYHLLLAICLKFFAQFSADNHLRKLAHLKHFVSVVNFCDTIIYNVIFYLTKKHTNPLRMQGCMQLWI